MGTVIHVGEANGTPFVVATLQLLEVAALWPLSE